MKLQYTYSKYTPLNEQLDILLYLSRYVLPRDMCDHTRAANGLATAKEKLKTVTRLFSTTLALVVLFEFRLALSSPLPLVCPSICSQTSFFLPSLSSFLALGFNLAYTLSQPQFRLPTAQLDSLHPVTEFQHFWMPTMPYVHSTTEPISNGLLPWLAWLDFGPINANLNIQTESSAMTRTERMWLRALEIFPSTLL
jgi:hypothetical protein